MAIQTLNTIKNWFKTSLKPSQQQFWDTWDSFRHKLDKVPVKEVEGIDELLNTKADKIALNDHITDIKAHASQVNTDWNSESGFSQLLNKPDFKTINGESVLGDGNITIEEGGLQNLDQTLANGNTSTKEMIFESNGGAITTYNNMGVLLRGNNDTNSSLSSLGFHTVGPNGLASIENKGLITVSHFGGSTLQLENNEIRHTTIDGNSSFLQFDNSEQGHFTQTIQPKTGTIALLSDISEAEYPNLQQILDSGNETYLEALFKSGEDEDIYENKVTPKQIEIKRSNDYTPDKNEMVSLQSDLIEIAKLNTGETTALFADGLGFGNSNSNNYSTLKLNPNTTANYSNVLMPAITEEGQTKTLATTEDLSLQGIVNANITATKNSGNATVDILKGEGEFVSSRTTIRSASSYNVFSSHEMGKNYHNITNRGDDKEASIEMTSGVFSLNQTNSTDRSKITTVNFLPPSGNNTISFPAPTGNDGSYVLTTTDDFKTINGQSIVGSGDITVNSQPANLQSVLDNNPMANFGNSYATIMGNYGNSKYNNLTVGNETDRSAMLQLSNQVGFQYSKIGINTGSDITVSESGVSINRSLDGNTTNIIIEDPVVDTLLKIPAKSEQGKTYTLATTDDFKTINGESIVGQGDISTYDNNALHKTGNESKEGDLNIIGNLTVSEYLGITGSIEITDLDTFPRPPETNIILDKNGDLTAKNFIGQSIASYTGEFYSKVKIGNSASNENKLEVSGTISTNGIKIGVTNTESSDTIFANTPVGSQKTISGNSIQIAGATGDYFLETFRYNASDYGMQRITFTSTASAGRFFIRTLTAGAWSAWVEK